MTPNSNQQSTPHELAGWIVQSRGLVEQHSWKRLARAYLDLEEQLEALRAERDHYRDHSPAGRVSFEDCEALDCEEARERYPAIRFVQPTARDIERGEELAQEHGWDDPDPASEPKA